MILSGWQVKIRKISAIVSIVVLLFSVRISLAAADNAHDGEAEFDPGKMIIEHVIDAHEWHILSYGDKHVSIPLPVILFDNGELVFFMSGKFHHPPQGFKYELIHEGPNEGRVVNTETDVLPLDLSITKNVASMFISMILISALFISIGRAYTSRKGQAPKGLQSLFEPLIIFVRDDIAKASIGEHKYEKFLPYLLTLFFFIFLNNLLGLVPVFPGGANLTGNIAVTGVLALFTFVINNVGGNKNYWMHIFNTPGVPWWLKLPVPLMPIVELLGVFIKPFVLMVRLFANITAGHIIVLGFMSLIFIFGNIHAGIGYGVSILSTAFVLFILMLELLVAFIQAYVFTFLSALFFGMATVEHH